MRIYSLQRSSIRFAAIVWLLFAVAACMPGDQATAPPLETGTAVPAAEAEPAAESVREATGTPTAAPVETALPTTAPATRPTAGWPAIVLTQRYSGLDNPVDFADARDGSGRLYVVEQNGLVQMFSDGVKSRSPFLDIRDRVTCCGEKGLLGIAFPPDFARSRVLYVNYTTEIPGRLHTRVSRFHLRADQHQVDPSSEEIILQFFQPWGNHNGGQIVFGPKGYLWVGTGDGGSGGDPQDNGQNGQTLLGKMLRIDVTTSSDAPYAIPADNPFVGNDAFLDEIWAYGLRNPWRFSFDSETDDLYIGDVGQSRWEEVSFQPADSPGGENYGWRITEGLHCYNPSSDCSTTGFTLPVAEYGRDSGQSITGGYVYRGASQPSLQGIYFFADFVTGRIWGLRNVNGPWEAKLLLKSSHSISSFGEDEAGNLYVVDYGGEILEIGVQESEG